MYYSVALFIAGVTAVAVASDEDCLKLTNPRYLHCCKGHSRGPPVDSDMEAIRECFQPHRKPPSCETEICIAKKKGYASDDGTIDKKALEANIEKEFEKDPELVEIIKKECVNGDISEYGPAGMCELGKMKHCIHMQIVVNCPEWDEQGPCKKVKELFEKCNKE